MHFLKKSFGIILLTLFSTQSFAFFCGETYIGLGVGPEYADFNKKALIIGNPPSAPAFRAIDRRHLAGRGGYFSLFAGIGEKFCFCSPRHEDIYLGAEINWNPRKVQFKAINVEFINENFGHEKYILNRDWGMSILPGILFSPCTLFYARLGFANARFKSDTTDTSLLNLSRTRYGFRYGLGARQELCDGFAFRIEYSQVDYHGVKMFTFDPVGVVAKTTKYPFHTQRFEFGLLYLF